MHSTKPRPTWWGALAVLMACLLLTANLHAQSPTPLFGGQLEPGPDATGFPHWTNGFGTGVDFAQNHPGLESESERSARIVANGSGHHFVQDIDTAGAPYWFLDFLFATELGGGGNAVQVTFVTNGLNGIPNVTVLNSGNLAIRDSAGFNTVIAGAVAASIDANANGDFTDAGDTLNVHRMRIVFHDWGTVNARFDLLLSEANVIDGTFAHHAYGLTTVQNGDPTQAANDSVHQIRFQGEFSRNDYIIDNVKTYLGPGLPLENGDLEGGGSPTDFAGWVNGLNSGVGFATETAGLVADSNRAVWIDTAGSGGNYRVYQDVDSAGADVWELDLLFATELGAGGNALQMVLGSPSHSTGTPNITVSNAGTLQLRQSVGWFSVFPSTVQASVDANDDGDFSDAGDTLNVHRLRVVGRKWGTENASYDLYLSDANVVDGTFAHRFFGATTFQYTSPTTPTDDSVVRLNFQAGFSSNDYVVDNVSLRFSTQGPGLPPQITRTVGDLIHTWDVGGDPDDPATGGRITTMGIHRGYLMTDTRDITTNGGALQVWDLSDLEDPREVTRGRFRRPFHVYFMEDDLYYNSDRQTFFDLSDMTDLRPAISRYTVPDSLQLRDWIVSPYAYIGQNGYGNVHQPAQIWDMRTGTLVAAGPEGLDFEVELGFEAQPFVIGNLMVVASSNINQAVATYDVSDPSNPVLLDVITNVPGRGYEPAIFGHYVVLGFPNGTDHVSFVDFSDPDDLHVEATILNPPGTNRYMQFQDDTMFIGDAKYDISDLQNINLLQTFDGGDEYLLPLGNLVAIGSTTGEVRVYAHQAAPDTLGPKVTYVNPEHGAVNQAVTTRIGVVIPETLDPQSITPQSFVVREEGGTEVVGTLSHNDKDVITFTPEQDLAANTTYEIELPQGGIRDVSGNGLEQGYLFRFSTGEAVTGGGNQPPVVASVDPAVWPAPVGGSVDLTAAASDPESGVLEYRWDFGDGSPRTAWGTSATVSHTFAAAGHYTVVVQVRDSFGSVAVENITVTVLDAPTNPAPDHSHPVILDEVTRLVWTVNPDNDSVTAIHADTLAVQFEQSVAPRPVSLAKAADGTIWVTCEEAGSVDVLDGATGVPVTHVDLGYGSGPRGIVTVGTEAFVALGGTGELVRLSTVSRTVTGTLALGRTPRAMAYSAGRLFVTRFISDASEGLVWEVDAATLTLTRSIPLAFDTTEDTSSDGSGVPNYLTGVTVSPDGQRAWVAAKKDNILRGALLSGENLTHENTVRAITAQIDLTTNAEVPGGRIDYDNTSLTAATAFSPLGDYAFVPSLGNNEFEVVDAFTNVHMARIEVGSAPSGMLVDPVTRRIFVKNFLDRSVTVLEGSDFFVKGDITMPELAVVGTVATESLTATELLGKQVFYHAGDPRMSEESYMSCASCHLDGGEDGQVWDFTERGEGLRNTTTLLGKSGAGHGVVHWTGNFDEIQDFELDIRGGFGGTGFIDDGLNGNAPWPSNDSNGNAGRNADLDALAVYVASLTEVPASPNRTASGGLTAAAYAGLGHFNTLGCAVCHSGTRFTDSGGDALNPLLHDVGTWLSSSGDRLGQANTSFDTPTLRGAWATPPYLHDGRYPTLAAFVAGQVGTGTVHDAATLNGAERDELVAFLEQLDDSDPSPNANYIHVAEDRWTQISGWKTVTHGGGFANPVVIVSPITNNDSDPSVVRVRNVGPDSFEYQVQEWDYLDGDHPGDETVHFLVMNEGTITIDGKQITAGSVSAVSSFATHTFPVPFPSTPVVMAQVVTENETETVISRMRNLTSTTWQLRLREEEASSSAAHGAETVHYIAVEAGDYPTLNARAGVTANAVTQNTYSVSFGTALGSGPPLLLADIQTRDGGDPCALRWIENSLTPTGVDLFLQEEDSDGNGDFNHTTEVVGWFMWGN